MRAVRGNKEYTISEPQVKAYKDAGFDIYDESGMQIAWGRGRTVPYEDHMKAVREIERLQSLMAERYAENEDLKHEIEALMAENAALKETDTRQRAPDPKQGRKPSEKKESV